MSHEAEQAGRFGGSTVILASAIGEWLISHGLSNAMVIIAIAGLLLQLVTSIPALERAYQCVKGWFRAKA